MKIIGEFLYPGVVITWKRHEFADVVTRHVQLDYEELCYENTIPEEFTTLDVVAARNQFMEWVHEFIGNAIDSYMPM